jgi:hypothetical protein
MEQIKIEIHPAVGSVNTLRYYGYCKISKKLFLWGKEWGN